MGDEIERDRLEAHDGLRRTTRTREETASARVVVGRSSGTAYQPLGSRRRRERPAGRPRRRRPERRRGIEVVNPDRRRDRSLVERLQRLLGRIRAGVRRLTRRSAAE